MKLEDYDDEYSPTAAAASRARQADPSAAERAAQARAESQRPRRRIVADERAQAAPLDSRADVAKALLRWEAATGVRVGVERKNKKGTRS